MNDLYKKYGFPSFDKFWKIIKDTGDYNYNEVKEFVKNNSINQVHYKKKPKKKFIVGTDKEYQADLLDMTKYKNANKGYSWILIVINLFNRKGYAVALKNKKPESVGNAFKKLGLDMDTLITDNGNEFKGKQRVKYEDRHIMNDVGDHKALGVVDNFSQNIKKRLIKYLTFTSRNNWVQYLDEMIDGYNNTPHSSLFNYSPNSIKDDLKYLIGKQNMNKRRHNLKVFRSTQGKLKVGNYIRLLKVKNQFTKGYEPNYTGEVFRIIELDGKYMVLNTGERLLKRYALVVNKNSDFVDLDEQTKARKAASKKYKLAREGISENTIIRGKSKRTKQKRKEKDIIFY